MSTGRFAAVSLLLLTASSVCSQYPPWPPLPPSSQWPPFSQWPPLPPWKDMPPLPPWKDMPPFPPWPPLPPWKDMPPFPPFSPWPPFPPGGGGGCSCTCNTPPPRPPKKFVVGGDKQWTFGYNYTDWALKNSPFYVGDELEFIYPLPVLGRPFNHSVVLLKDYQSFIDCNLEGSLKIGNEYAGGGSDGGFKLKLEPRPPWAPLYFVACGEKNGFHCNVGTMKFIVMPLYSGRFKH